MRDDHHSSEEQFQMEDPVWRELNGFQTPEDQADLGTPNPVSLKVFVIFVIGGAIAFNVFRYLIMGD